MEERINDKIEELETYLEQLLSIAPENLEEYEKDFKTKAACERLFEKIIEAVIDISFLFIRKKKYPFPEDDEAVFNVLAEKRIITTEFAKKLQDAKSMRNFIIHKYGEIDDSKVFYSIKEEIENDVNKFIKLIEKEK